LDYYSRNVLELNNGYKEQRRGKWLKYLELLGVIGRRKRVRGEEGGMRGEELDGPKEELGVETGIVAWNHSQLI